MPKKIVFIGAGSAIFTRNLTRDILTYPALKDCIISLVDIDEARLQIAVRAVEKIIREGRYPARVEATTDRTAALPGADAVLCTIQVGGERHLRADLEIPKKYGVNINIGDTRGPAGVFRFLRTAPVLEAICRDIERLCPNAYFLNYTNPMSMLCGAIQKRFRIRTVGLCHSVQHTAAMLAEWIGASPDEISYLCAGINHQAWYLTFERNGRDAYPLIRAAVETPEVYNRELVRNEMFRHLGLYVTESSGHNSEYNPWFRKRDDLIEKYCLHGTGDNPGEPFLVLKEMEPGQNWRTTAFAEFLQEPVDLARGDEYASGILNAVIGDGEPFLFYGNVLNRGLIDNLPPDSCVEVPVTATPDGFEPQRVGSLPRHLAMLNSLNAGCDDLAVEGYFAFDSEKVYQALAFDPLTAAVLSLDEIRSMTDEMLDAAREWLPEYRRL